MSDWSNKPASDRLVAWATQLIAATPSLSGLSCLAYPTEGDPSAPGVYLSVSSERYAEQWSDAVTFEVFILFAGKRSDASKKSKVVRDLFHREPGRASAAYAVPPSVCGLRVSKLKYVDGLPAGQVDAVPAGHVGALLRFVACVS